MAKDSHWKNYSEGHSLSSDQVFISIQLKTFSKFRFWSYESSSRVPRSSIILGLFRAFIGASFDNPYAAKIGV